MEEIIMKIRKAMLLMDSVEIKGCNNMNSQLTAVALLKSAVEELEGSSTVEK